MWNRFIVSIFIKHLTKNIIYLIFWFVWYLCYANDVIIDAFQDLDFKAESVTNCHLIQEAEKEQKSKSTTGSDAQSTEVRRERSDKS